MGILLFEGRPPGEWAHSEKRREHVLTNGAADDIIALSMGNTVYPGVCATASAFTHIFIKGFRVGMWMSGPHCQGKAESSRRFPPCLSGG